MGETQKKIEKPPLGERRLLKGQRTLPKEKIIAT